MTTPPADRHEPRPGMVQRLLVGRDPRRTLVRAAAIALAAYGVFGFLFLPIWTDGASMDPTYRSGSLNFINTLAYRVAEPARGDVVGIRMAGPRIMYLKRIVGLPGERVRIEQGVLVVDDRPVEEPYLVYRAPWNVPEVVLGAGEYFVIGDNRGMDARAHEFGRTSRTRILGRVIF